MWEIRLKGKDLWPLFIDWIQLSQGYRGAMKRQFFFTIQFPGLPGAQAELTLEPTSGFEPRTSGLDIIYFLNKYRLKLILCVL